MFGEIYPRGRDSDLKTCKELLLKAKDSNISFDQVDVFVKKFAKIFGRKQTQIRPSNDNR